MDYVKWRSDLFDHLPPHDPCLVDLSEELHFVMTIAYLRFD